MAAKSFDELYNLGKAEALLRRPDLFIAAGDVTDFLLAAAAAMADHNEQFIAEEIRKTFVDTATGDDLTTLADDHFDIQRQLATPAVSTTEFTRPSAGGGEPAGTIDAGTTVATEIDEGGNAQEYVTDADIVVGLGALGPFPVGVTAAEPGSDGNVAIGRISRIIDVIGFDGTFLVTNPVIAGGGNEEETDEELRERVRNRPLTFRRATLAALEQGALTVDSVRVATATEDLVTGAVTVFVSDSDGNSTLQMISDVELALEEFRAAGVTVSVVGGSVLTVAVTVTLTLAPGAVASVLETPVIEAIAEQINKLTIGQTLFDTMITTAARNVDSTLILDVDYLAGDITPLANELIRAGVITVL